MATAVPFSGWSVTDQERHITYRLFVDEAGWYSEKATADRTDRWVHDSLRDFEDAIARGLPADVVDALVTAARSEKRCGHHPEVVLRPPTAAYIDEEYEHIRLACPGCFPNLFAPDPIDYRQVAADLRIQIAAIEVELRAARRVSDN